jgi:hypothetical protein
MTPDNVAVVVKETEFAATDVERVVTPLGTVNVHCVALCTVPEVTLTSILAAAVPEDAPVALKEAVPQPLLVVTLMPDSSMLKLGRAMEIVSSFVIW